MSVFQFLSAISCIIALSAGQRFDGQYWPCNPTVNATGACTPNPGLPTSSYYVDFTKQTSLPDNWSIANYETVTYGTGGAEFTFAERYDAPQIWTDFYILFGRVETVMQIAPGQGIISSSVLISDDFDELDWELSGNNFAMSTGMGQNNYFGKGVTGSYDRGQFFKVTSPQTQYHTYAIDWSPDNVTWSVDGVAIRTLLAADCDDNEYQFPQSPSKIQLGLWDGGDAGENSGTVSWAGGYTNLSLAPFTMYVKSIKITNLYPAWAYNYTDQSGSWKSIQLIQEPVAASSSSSTSSSTSLAPSASSSLASAKASQLSSLGDQFAGTASDPSTTASTASQSSSTRTGSTSTKATSAASEKTTTTSSTQHASSSTVQNKETSPKFPHKEHERPHKEHGPRRKHWRSNGHGGWGWAW